VWTSFGVLAFVFDLGVHSTVHHVGWLDENDWLIGASVLALAGAFQLTRLKDTCLEQCRHPAAFLVRYYRRGARGGFGVGARHGVFCVGCCWALMLVMFAVGIANLVWMAALSLVMVYEKTQPAGRRAVPLTGVVLLTLGAAVALASAWDGGL
jgi:predicted metal-binding membrane protein